MSKKVRENLPKGPWFAQDKLDGSQIRAEWDKKRGFYKFGTRTHLIDRDFPLFGEAIELILAGYSELLGEFFPDHKIERAVVFFEFLGEHSFAGNHEDEPHQVFLTDISTYKFGLVDPVILGLLEDKVPCAAQLWVGTFPKEEDFRAIERSEIEGMTFEGIVFKYGVGTKRLMFKHKSKAWLDKLSEVCADNKARFEELR